MEACGGRTGTNKNDRNIVRAAEKQCLMEDGNVTLDDDGSVLASTESLDGWGLVVLLIGNCNVDAVSRNGTRVNFWYSFSALSFSS